jgi:hypothetical protein
MAVTSFSSLPRLTAFGNALATTSATDHRAAETSLLDGGTGPIRGGRGRVVNACDHCGGRFGMVTYRWWGSKFCKKTCKAAFLRELGLSRDEICRWFVFLWGGMVSNFSCTIASSPTASAQP